MVLLFHNLFLVLINIAFISIQVRAGEQHQNACVNLKVSQLSESCASLESTVKSLADFKSFGTNYSHLNACLHSQEPSDEARRVEAGCLAQGIQPAQMSLLSRLIERLERGELICTAEFASKLWRLHNQTEQVNKRLALAVASLAQLVASKCRASLAARLLDVEQRAPDSVKHLKLILGLLNVRQSLIELLPLEADAFVPILEREIEAANLNRETSLEFGVAGFEFRLPASVSLDAARMSCSALATYQVNILGSLGLTVASASWPQLKPLDEEPESERLKIRQWLLSSIICQSLKSVFKMSTLSVDGRLVRLLKIFPVQEADLSAAAEFDDTFATYKLPELVDPVDLSSVLLQTAKKVNNNNNNNALRRKMLLISGPTYSLAASLQAYLDLTKPNRHEIPYALLGLKPPGKEEDDDDDEDE